MDEHYTDDDLFDNVDEVHLLNLERYSDEDVFENVDESEFLELERPTKRRRSEDPVQVKTEDTDEEDLASLPPLPAKNPEHLELAERLLGQKFGYKSFRHEQAGAIQSILAGDNNLVIFPTGAGTSLCYQFRVIRDLRIPAIIFPELDRKEGTRRADVAGITLVVSPLLALMKDQVDSLQKRGIAAASLDSDKSFDDLKGVYADLSSSFLRILYVAPERLNNEGFVEGLKKVKGGIRLLAVDEAHCVFGMGPFLQTCEFRVPLRVSHPTDDLRIISKACMYPTVLFTLAQFAKDIKTERVICLTATATPRVARDIAKAFRIRDSNIFRTSPYRPNLQLFAQSIVPPPESNIPSTWMRRLLPELGLSIHDHDEGESAELDGRFHLLFSFLDPNPGPTLVYVALQQQAESHAEILCSRGYKAAPFHAGMKPDMKRIVQEDFMSDRIQIVCATIAFGMGIDKPNIRNVVNWDLANSIEEYSQQIGRAGRDGLQSKCVFYLAPPAFYLRQIFARGDVASRMSIDRLLGDIAYITRNLDVGDIFSVNHLTQSYKFDIRMSRMGVMYALLELTLGLFRATTPVYATCTYEAKAAYDRAKADRSQARAIFAITTSKNRKHFDVGINAAARLACLKRADLVRKLRSWDELGYVVVHTFGIIQRYIIQKPIPRTKAGRDRIAESLYADSLLKEQEALHRGQAMIDLITGSRCFALALAEHFGTGLPDNKAHCGHCTFCLTKIPVESPSGPRETNITPGMISGVLAATNVRDDPRFLARVAFGIKSPRITKMKLHEGSAFR
ncbi:P-loop containing nucleoside triphosphate hydrolase protein [Rhypophila sp. PSN 637]